MRTFAEVKRLDWTGLGRRLSVLCLLLTLPGTLFRYCGSYLNSFAYFETLSNLTLPSSIFLLVTYIIAAICRSFRWALILIPSLLLNLSALSPYFPRVKPAFKPSFSLLTHNLYFDNKKIAEEVGIILKQDTDLIALTEVSDRLIEALGSLRAKYPHHIEHALTTPFGLALYSKYPLTTREIVHYVHPSLPSIRATVLLPYRFGSRETVIVVTHPPPGVNDRNLEIRNSQLRSIVEGLKNDPSVIITGDFNMTMWSYWYPYIFSPERWRNSREGIGIFPTWDSRLPKAMGVPIDHVITSKDIEATDVLTIEETASDHRPMKTLLQFND